MKQRSLALLLALALAFTLLPAGAWAAQPEEFEEDAPGCEPLADTLPDNDVLFEGYVEQTLYGDSADGVKTQPRGYARSLLTGADLKLYDALKEKIFQVANGTLDSSEFTFNTVGWGITYSNKIAGVDTVRVRRALQSDCPYEMYWFDKTVSVSRSWHHKGTEVTDLTLKFPVAQEYALGVGEEFKYRPDTAKTGAATATLHNAVAVVNRYKEYTDYDKMLAYQEYIRDQITYNDTAADDDNYPYGNPWQMIYVFDNDPNTNVVCEGYSKAFKYLCDLSHFSNNVDCCLVNGSNHAWNLVRINGQSYMVDITAADTGMSVYGSPGFLFLAGTPDSNGDGFTIHIPRYDLPDGRYYSPRDKTYTYYDWVKEQYDPSVLTLAPTSYGPFNRFSDLSPTGYYRGAVEWAVINNITTGATNTTFEPDAQCTHGQILTFLWRAAGSPKSSAEPPIPMTGSEYYYDALKWAKEINILTKGFNADTPDTPCSRIYAVYYMWLANGRPETPYSGVFTDIATTSNTASAVAWALQKGITTGATSTTFEPNTICTRGQIVTFLRRCYGFTA